MIAFDKPTTKWKKGKKIEIILGVIMDPIKK